jgi:hypothetical protein
VVLLMMACEVERQGRQGRDGDVERVDTAEPAAPACEFEGAYAIREPYDGGEASIASAGSDGCDLTMSVLVGECSYPMDLTLVPMPGGDVLYEGMVQFHNPSCEEPGQSYPPRAVAEVWFSWEPVTEGQSPRAPGSVFMLIGAPPDGTSILGSPYAFVPITP